MMHNICNVCLAAGEPARSRRRDAGFEPPGLGQCLLVLLVLAASAGLVAQVAPAAPVAAAPAIQGVWLGAELPGETPVQFAGPQLDSLSHWVETLAFSPDGREMFLGIGNATYSSSRLMWTRQTSGGIWAAWTTPPFVSDFILSGEPVYAADGNSLTFTGKKTWGDSNDLWVVRRSGDGWDAPEALPAPINTATANEFRACWMPDGSLYFGSMREGPMHIYHATRDPAGQWAVQALPAALNLLSTEGDPCVAPDGRFIIFYGGQSQSDLSVSFADGAGGWTTPARLGSAFNSMADEYGACLSADGKFLFFTRHTRQRNTILWVAVSAIDQLRP